MLRWKKMNRSSCPSSILPQTIQDDSNHSSPQRHYNKNNGTLLNSPSLMNSNHAVTCTSFLMGGAYYPGKDKKVLHMRRKTLWYRIFWSSPIRRGLSLLLICYIFLYFIWIPFTTYLMHYGHLLSKDNTSHNIIHDDSTTLYNTTHHQAIRLDPSMTKLKVSSNRRIRYKVIQRIVPDWFKGNHPFYNPNDSQDDNEDSQESNSFEKEYTVPPSKEKDGHILNDNATNHERVLISQEDSILTLRTLKNRPLHHVHSKCHTTRAERNSTVPTTTTTTLVLQGTLNRLPMIHLTCQRWTTSPIVMVLYMTKEEQEDESIPSWSDLVWKYTSTCPQLTLIPYISSHDSENNDNDPTTEFYPINKLRNIGLDQVQTSHVLVLDIDFIPSEGLDGAIQNVIHNLHENDAMVVPAFQRNDPQPPCVDLETCLEYIQENGFIPTSTTELKTCIRSKDCDIFQKNVKPQGHFDTNYKRWIKEIDSHENIASKSSMHRIECFHTLDYEPYVVVPWCPMDTLHETNDNEIVPPPKSPYYDERFQGYGKNKIQMTSHLRSIGYKFWVMPSDGFIIHVPHPISNTKENWIHNRENLHKRMDQLYSQYLKELEHEYHKESKIVTPLCSDGV